MLLSPAIFVALARIGYGARGVIYLMVGGLAAAAAAGAAQRPSGAGDAFDTLFSQRAGAVLVAAIAIGLVCFALWRLAQSLLDADHHGRSSRAMLTRTALFVSSLMYVSMAGSAVALLLGYQTKSGDQKAHDWTIYLNDLSFWSHARGLDWLLPDLRSGRFRRQGLKR